MPGSNHGLLNCLRLMVNTWRDGDRTDAELVAHFAATRDESAFTALVGRHGALVWRTCRSVLDGTADAEDAFQATFITLARKAGRFRVTSLAGWLHRVARQAALDHFRAKTLMRRRLHHRSAPLLPA